MGLYDSAQQNAPGQTTGKPVYSGLMGGDYDKLQKSLATGGRYAAEDAYNTGTRNLVNTMGGNGIYGSSIMQQQQTQGLDREYMRALATNESNAAATRYGMQQADYKTAYDGAVQGYGIDTQADTAAKGLLSNERINTNNNNTQRYGIDTTALTAERGLLSNERMNTANNDTTLTNTRLQGENSVNVANINQAASNYGADRQFDSNANRDQTTIATTNITAAMNKYGIDTTRGISENEIAAGLQRASDTNNTADLATFATLGGVTLAAVLEFKAKGGNFSTFFTSRVP